MVSISESVPVVLKYLRINTVILPDIGSQDLDELGKMEQKTDEKEVQLSDSQNINNGQKKVKDWPLTLPPKPLVSLRLPTNKTILKRRIEQAGTMNRIKRGRRIIRSISVQNKIIRRSSAIPTGKHPFIQYFSH